MPLARPKATARLILTLLVASTACAVDEAPVGERAQAVAPSDFATWVAAHEVALTGVEAETGLAELAPLAAHLGGARVIGLGEATHGSREIFQLKHRLIEYLVAERGVRVLAFEAGVPEAQDVDAYLQTGHGDPARAIAGLGYWPWMTEELVELIEWMRRWNQTHRHDPVVFRGIDMQVPDRAARDALAFLAEVDPVAHGRFAATLASATSRYDFFTLDPDTVDALRIEAEALVAHLDAHADAFTAATTPERFAWARQLARVVAQATAMTYLDLTGGDWDGSNVRDAAMADNLQWILERDAPNGAVALWAHNDHLSRGFLDPGFVNLGQLLAARLGDGYRAIGSGFDRGGFQALASTFVLQEFIVDSGGPETLDGALAETAAPVAIVPLTELPPDGPIADWFATTPYKRDITAGYLEALGELYFRPIPVRDYYDALAWVATTTRARPTRYARDQLAPPPVAATAVNLDLEAHDREVPTGWFAPVSNEVGGYQVRSTPAHQVGDDRSAVLFRDNQPGYGRNYGELRQRISAVPYRGRRVRLRAEVRAETGPGARVHLFARAGVAYDGMHDRPITTSDWTAHELELTVPARATTLQFGLVVVGDGAAWIDDVSLTPLP